MMTTIHILLDAELKARIFQTAKKLDVDASKLCRIYIRSCLDQNVRVTDLGYMVSPVGGTDKPVNVVITDN